MKNNISCSDTFDKHKECIVEFKLCEIAKQFDIEINMGNCTWTSPIPPCPPCDKYNHKHRHKHHHKSHHRHKYHKECNKKHDSNCCNDNSLLMLLVALVIRYFNLKCGND
jgi:hypothetical protein